MHSPMLRTRWVDIGVLGGFRQKAEDEGQRCKAAPGWNPRLVHLRGDLFVADTCFNDWRDAETNGPRVVLVKLALVRGHPCLEQMQDAPRALRNVYRKSNRVAFMTAGDCWDFFAKWGAAMAAARHVA